MLRALAVIAALAATPAAAQQPAASEARIRADMAALSADAMQGRKPGTKGEQLALGYVRRAFEQAGLKPGAKDGWLQPVALVERSPVSATLEAQAGGETLDISRDAILIGRSAQESMKGALAYAGFAVAADPALKERIVLYRDADAPGASAGPSPTDAFSRYAALDGASIALAIVDDAGFETQRRRTHGAMGLASEDRFLVRGFIRESAARRLLAAAGEDLTALDARAAQPDFRAVRIAATIEASARTAVRAFTSHNLIGRIDGVKRPDEAVVYTAHWDSFGLCRPGESDPLCNGAVDNASGVAGMIELARMFQAGPRPDRTILFVATTAEEQGLLGARAYAAAPPVSLARTVAAFNIDTIALYPRGNPAGFVGAGLTTADETFAAAAAAQGRKLDTGAGARIVLKSSDAWAMLRAGVPAYILSGVIARDGPDKGRTFLSYVGSRYHGPDDEMSDALPMGGAAEEIELVHAAGRIYSAADAKLDFLPASPFQRPLP